MNIVWNQVTKFSQIAAIIIFVAVFGVGFLVGRKFENKTLLGTPNAVAKFVCPDKSVISASFYDRMAEVKLPKMRSLLLTQTISGSGARYATKDESIVFWNKGDMVFVEQNGTTTYDNCVAEEK